MWRMATRWDNTALVWSLVDLSFIKFPAPYFECEYTFHVIMVTWLSVPEIIRLTFCIFNNAVSILPVINLTLPDKLSY